MNNTQKWGIYWVVVASLACAGGVALVCNSTKEVNELKSEIRFNVQGITDNGSTSYRSFPHASVSVAKRNSINYSVRTTSVFPIIAREVILDGKRKSLLGIPPLTHDIKSRDSRYDDGSLDVGKLELGVHELVVNAWDVAGRSCSTTGKFVVTEY